MDNKPILVNTSAGLARAVAKLKPFSELGLDLEADSLYHYFEKVCLMQITGSKQVFLVDPLAGIDITPLLQLLADKLLIIHGANYDLRQLKRNFGFVPWKIFDTMAAAQLTGQTNFSLKALVEKYFNLELSKSAQKLNWSERPLTKPMLDYAAKDAAFLPELKRRLSQELQQLGRLTWVEESCQQIQEAALTEKPANPPDKEWRFKGTSTLTGHSLAYAKALWYWRETEARMANRPSFKILSNELLLNLSLMAALFPCDAALTKVKLPRDFTGRRLASLRQTLAETAKLSPAHWPQDRFEPHTQRVIRVIDGELVKKLTDYRDAKAAALGLDPALLANRAALDDIAYRKPLTLEQLKTTGSLMQWQAEALGADILTLIRLKGKKGVPA